MCPSVGAKEVLPLYGSKDVAQQRLDVALDCILPLLVRCGAFVRAVVGLVESRGLERAEGCVVVAAEYAGRVAAGRSTGQDSKGRFPHCMF